MNNVLYHIFPLKSNLKIKICFFNVFEWKWTEQMIIFNIGIEPVVEYGL